MNRPRMFYVLTALLGVILFPSGISYASPPTFVLREYFDTPIEFDQLKAGVERRYVEAVSAWWTAKSREDVIGLYLPSSRDQVFLSDAKKETLRVGRKRIDLSKSKLLGVVEYRSKGRDLVCVASWIVTTDGLVNRCLVDHLVVDEGGVWQSIDGDLFSLLPPSELKDGASRKDEIKDLQNRMRKFASSRLIGAPPEMTIERLLKEAPEGVARWPLEGEATLGKPSLRLSSEGEKAASHLAVKILTLEGDRAQRESARKATTGSLDPSTQAEKDLEAKVDEEIERLEAEIKRISTKQRSDKP